jgi:hypothetical protein
MLQELTQDETEELRLTATSFTKRLKEIYEGGEDVSKEEAKREASTEKPHDMVSLKNPSMLTRPEPKPSNYGPSQVSVERNPFQFIEAALIEAKQKIEKMKATP